MRRVDLPGAMSRPDGGADAELVARIAGGDRDAFMTAYDTHADALYGAAVRLFGDREAAADVVQDAFLTLWRRAATFEASRGSLRAWLLTVARNRAIDRLRADARLVTALPLAGAGSDDRTSEPAAPAADDPGIGAERRWARAVVRTSLTLVSEDEREVLVLAYRDGLSQSAIADHLGLPLGTVKSRSRRGLAHLRDMLLDVPDLIDAPMEALDGSR